VRKWTSTGYLKAQRHYLRHYISESEIQGLLKRLPVQEGITPMMPQAEPQPVVLNEAPLPQMPTLPTDLSRLPDQLREQRAAVLNYVNQPASNDADNANNSHE
jgi:hypothetical protein